jgi:hypothetical protein
MFRHENCESNKIEVNVSYPVNAAYLLNFLDHKFINGQTLLKEKPNVKLPMPRRTNSSNAFVVREHEFQMKLSEIMGRVRNNLSLDVASLDDYLATTRDRNSDCTETDTDGLIDFKSYRFYLELGLGTVAVFSIVSVTYLHFKIRSLTATLVILTQTRRTLATLSHETIRFDYFYKDPQQNKSLSTPNLPLIQVDLGLNLISNSTPALVVLGLLLASTLLILYKLFKRDRRTFLRLEIWAKNKTVTINLFTLTKMIECYKFSAQNDDIRIKMHGCSSVLVRFPAAILIDAVEGQTKPVVCLSKINWLNLKTVRHVVGNAANVVLYLQQARKTQILKTIKLKQHSAMSHQAIWTGEKAAFQQQMTSQAATCAAHQATCQIAPPVSPSADKQMTPATAPNECTARLYPELADCPGNAIYHNATFVDDEKGCQFISDPSSKTGNVKTEP